jgi:hypothetical protein
MLLGKRKKKGQSLVEMALLLPLLLIVLFGIIDLGWYLFAYVTVWNAARDGAEVAAQVPPTQDILNRRENGIPAWSGNLPAQPPQYPTDATDPCVCAILRAAGVSDHACAAGNRGLYPFTTSEMSIGYPPVLGTGNPRSIGRPIEVRIDTTVQPLTPLVQLVGGVFSNGGTLRIQATIQRTIENLGNNPNYENGVACRSS